ncbi:Putative membrane protein YeiH [Richelia intracellularis]|nr:Putative membrane protein YeiH [Richelia intracellularis]
MVESKDEDVTYAVAIVPKIVTISMLLYPLLPVRFDITSQEI